MAFIPVTNVCKVEMVYDLNGVVAENVFHVLSGDGFPTGKLDTIGEIFTQWWLDVLSLEQSHVTTLSKVILTDLTSSSSASIEFTDGLPTTAGGSGDLPNNVTIAVKLLTANRGRSFRGRFYHLGLFPGQLSDTNHFSSVHAASLVDAVEDLIAALIVEDCELVVVSYVTGGAPRSSGLPTVITGASVDLTLDSQRRRLPGRGS